MSADTPIAQQPCEPPTLASLNSQDQLLPRLGNFSRILISSRADWELSPVEPSRETENHAIVSEKTGGALQDSKLDSCTRLGDFHRVFSQFQSLSSFEAEAIETLSSNSCHLSDVEASSSADLRLNPRVRKPIFTILKRTIASQPPLEDALTSDADSMSDSDRCLELEPPVFTPASTPPSPQPKRFVAVKKSAPGKAGKSKTNTRWKSSNGILLSYHLGKDSPACHIYGHIRTKEQKHEALMMELTPNRILDAAMAKKYPKVASHGAHVFVDMSNIDIGFQKALRARYKLGDNAHFSPLPHLNLEFLNELLIRGRNAVTRSVGCSIVPGRPEPRYIQELQGLGYHVDLRERKPIQGANNASLNVRYVEDLVDETLQTRIAESVMEYFQQQGTIILATGDAKPAQYSDGFFAYAERALRMGWHMELASWRGSLSSAWTSRKWKAQWGNRFRIIELDDFLDNILAFDP